MARRAVTAPVDGKRPGPLISVLVGYETFAGRICELASGTVITPGTVAKLLDEAVIERIVFDGPSRVIDLGRARRFTGALRRALEVRDRGCTHHSCDAPLERCQGDHIEAWTAGGATTVDNGQLRCGFHNRWRWTHPEPDPPDNTATGTRPRPTTTHRLPRGLARETPSHYRRRRSGSRRRLTEPPLLLGAAPSLARGYPDLSPRAWRASSAPPAGRPRRSAHGSRPSRQGHGRGRCRHSRAGQRRGA